jgi:hypothetical protein
MKQALVAHGRASRQEAERSERALSHASPVMLSAGEPSWARSSQSAQVCRAGMRVMRRARLYSSCEGRSFPCTIN